MNLTTLQNLKDWLQTSTNSDDALMSRLITQMSGMIYAYLQRSSLIQSDYTDNRNGSGNCRMMLSNWPVLSVGSVYVNNTQIPKAPIGPNPSIQAGWFLSPWSGQPPGRAQTVDLHGYNFWQGLGNVSIAYVAGYVVQNEPQTIPMAAAYGIIPNQFYGSWAADSGVAYASGAALSAVAVNPAEGQYVAPIYGQTSGYQFSEADAGKAVLLSYSYIPAPIEQACIELCAERYQYRSRIGERSHSLGGSETVSYNLAGIPDAIGEMLRPYIDMTQDFSV